MLSHGDDGNTLNTNHYNLDSRVSSRSTTLSSSSSSNISMFSNNTRTMEEVWKDINLSATNDHPTAAVTGHRGFILQDFLAKPFSSNDKPSSASSAPVPLILNSGPVQLNLLTEDPTRNVCSVNVPFDQALGSAASSSGLLGHSIGGMRILQATDRTGGDRRHKRMIKNRESAARSRARKQAYTNELENEVERLKVENAKLKRQQKQLILATTAQMTKTGGLQRTSSAPC